MEEEKEEEKVDGMGVKNQLVWLPSITDRKRVTTFVTHPLFM